MNTKNEIPEVDIEIDEKAGVIREIKPEKFASKKANERRANTTIYVILVLAVINLVAYNLIPSVKNEEDFQ